MEARPLALSAVGEHERTFGAEHANTARAISNLGAVYRALGELTEAADAYGRALRIREKVLGANHRDVGTTCNDLAGVLRSLARENEAEALYKRAISIYEASLGLEHPWVATALNNLGVLYKNGERYSEADRLYLRALQIREKVLGAEHADVGVTLNNMAESLRAQRRHGDLETLYTRALSIFEKHLGPDHPSVATVQNNLAELQQDRGRLAEAEALLRRALAVREASLGRDHPEVAQSLGNLAWVVQHSGRVDEAMALFKRSLTILAARVGNDHPDVAVAFNNLAWLAVGQKDLNGAAAYWRSSTRILIKKLELGLRAQPEFAPHGDRLQVRAPFEALIKILYQRGGAAREEDIDEAFELSQWLARSEAGSAVAQMTARAAGGNPDLDVLVRKRQDLVAEWQAKNKERVAAFSQPTPRNLAAEALVATRLEFIETQLGSLDIRLALEFPRYARFAAPLPLRIDRVRASLAETDALVHIVPLGGSNTSLPEQTLVWVITKREARWYDAGRGLTQLARDVATLRCGLDWDGSWQVANSRCPSLFPYYTAQDRDAGKPEPFDAFLGHALYQAILEPARDLIAGKRLLVVAAGPLAQIPFSTLLTRRPAAQPATLADYRALAWLSRDHAVTSLPAVSNLAALRDTMRSQAQRPYLGIGNPLLSGPDESHAESRRLARERSACPPHGGQRPTGSGSRKGRNLRSVDIASLRLAAPLPDTAEEICEVALALKAEASDVLLAERATKSMLLELSRASKLQQYRVLHFATHGALAGEAPGSSEPGLILTPPAVATGHDDGYLSAADITTLKLDAELVVLSACNTAGGARVDAEVLSGMARAFFYAGARGLVVSHWYVNSEAAVQLIQGMVEAMRRRPAEGVAEALRKAMLNLKGADDSFAHPSVWAPFVFVGDSAGVAQ